jgi:alanine racemase
MSRKPTWVVEKTLERALLEGIVTWAEIDLDAIAENVSAFQRHVGEKVEVIAVVKANAYGHGAVPVARTILGAGAASLAVHRAIEGIELRQAGIKAPILLMGYTPPDGARLVVEWELTPSMMTFEFAQVLSAYASAVGIIQPVHVKIDTGMNRYGLMPEEVVDFFQAVGRLPGIFVEGLFTHFATADWVDQTHTRQQLAVFNQVLQALRQAGFELPLVHAANSAAAMYLPESHFNAVRPGVALYGMHPSNEQPPAFSLRPALSLKSRVTRVRELSPSSGVSYGRTFLTTVPTQAVLVPVGYGDGYSRSLSNKGVVLIGGQRAAIIGRICMDQFVVNISGIQGVQQDDEVVLIGEQGGERILAEEVASLAGTINYEVTTALLPRVVRVYLKGGQIVDDAPSHSLPE